MRKIVFLFPGSTSDYQGGGFNVAMDFYKSTSNLYESEIVFYNEVTEDALAKNLINDTGVNVYVVTWGPDVEKIINKINVINQTPQNIIYFAQSSGWDITIPNNVPIICVSRSVMNYWLHQKPFNHVYLLPPILNINNLDQSKERLIDVLFVSRKSTHYVKEKLIPKLSKNFNVKVIDEFIDKEELIKDYCSSKVYIYSSREHNQTGKSWGEGFGLQPLEAAMCGATVFSNLNGGLVDHMDPGFNMFQIEVHSLQYDYARVAHEINFWSNKNNEVIEGIRSKYSEESFNKRISTILINILNYFEIIRDKDCYDFIEVRKTNNNLKAFKKFIKRVIRYEV
ncbi:glycosyltransferase [Cobetia crustatorum]|uniref:glycosyltransferase n=1 Tax=Cobetia crustatorum TaxID=553385 RepID=UPI0004B3C898|nr:glycosyltransferase [Cobetia crustatorum]